MSTGASTQITAVATHLTALMDRGRQHEAAGEIEEAAAVYRQVLAVKSDHVEAMHRLAICAFVKGDLEEAECFLERARRQGGDTRVLHDLGSVLAAAGRHREAIDWYREALRHHPANAATYYGLALVHERLHEVNEATTCLRNAIRLDERSVDAHRALGRLLEQQEDLTGAAACFEKAIALAPDVVETRIELARNHMLRDQPLLALDDYLLVLAEHPGMVDALSGLAALLRDRRLKAYPPAMDAVFVDALRCPAVCSQYLAKPIAHFLRLKHEIDDALRTGAPPLASIRPRLDADPLWLAYLERCINTDPQMEFVIHETRSGLLRDYWSKELVDEATLRLIAALVEQFLHNGHVLPVSDDERQILAQLAVAIETAAAQHDPRREILELRILLYALCASPKQLPSYRELKRIPADQWRPQLRRLLEHALYEEESFVAPGVFGAVPFRRRLEEAEPEWQEQPTTRDEELREITARPLQAILRERFPNSPLIPEPQDQLRVLVVGCGTGEKAVQAALSYRGARVTGIDTSRRRLFRAHDLVKRLGVANVKLVECDLFSVERLKETFHLIECVGVLHHTRDPFVGLRTLSSVLAEGGLLRLALHSRRARRRLVDARRRVVQLGLGPTLPDIVELRQSVLNGKEPELVELLLHEEFYTLSGCRTLLFQSIEHRFSPLQLADMLAEIGLAMIGFEFVDSRTPRIYRQHSPDDRTMTDLSSWERFEDEYPTTFMRMMRFWCRRAPPAPKPAEGAKPGA